MAQGTLRLDQQFVNFSKFGDTAKTDGKSIALSQIDKWFTQAGIISRKLTKTDTGLTFSKFKARAIPYQDFLKFLEDLSRQKDIPVEVFKEKLQTCGVPGTGKSKKDEKPPKT